MKKHNSIAGQTSQNGEAMPQNAKNTEAEKPKPPHYQKAASPPSEEPDQIDLETPVPDEDFPKIYQSIAKTLGQFVLQADEALKTQLEESLAAVLKEACANLPKHVLEQFNRDYQDILDKALTEAAGNHIIDSTDRISVEKWAQQIVSHIKNKLQQQISEELKENGLQKPLVKATESALGQWLKTDFKDIFSNSVEKHLTPEYQKTLIELLCKKQYDWALYLTLALACLIFFFLGKFYAQPGGGGESYKILQKVERLETKLTQLQEILPLSDHGSSQPLNTIQTPKDPSKEESRPNNTPEADRNTRQREYFITLFESSSTDRANLTFLHTNPLGVYAAMEFDEFNPSAADYETVLGFFDKTAFLQMTHKETRACYMAQRLVHNWANENTYRLTHVDENERQNYLDNFVFDGQWGDGTYKILKAFAAANQFNEDQFQCTSKQPLETRKLLYLIYFCLAGSV